MLRMYVLKSFYFSLSVTHNLCEDCARRKCVYTGILSAFSLVWMYVFLTRRD